MNPSFKFTVLAVVAIIFASNNASAQQMTYELVGFQIENKLGPQETITKSITTGNHHCDSNCKGEPTRTGYRIEIPIDQNRYKINSASLSCDSGICAFSQAHYARISGNRAEASFDVWSRPMKWTLTATVQPRLQVQGAPVQIDSDAVPKGKTFIVEHEVVKFTAIVVDANIPDVGTIRFDPETPPNSYFDLLAKAESGNIISYTLRYR